MNRAEKYSLLLLAGGKSSRMGKNKAELLYKGKTFVENLIAKAQVLGITNIYLSGYQEKREDVQIVWDVYPDRGPLGGMHACMKEMRTPYCLVLPVDVPQIPQEILEELLRFHEKNGNETADRQLPVLLKHGERRENLIGIYPVQMVDFIEELIKEHPASVHRMLDTFGNRCFDLNVPGWQVENINTQENYESLLSMHKRVSQKS